MKKAIIILPEKNNTTKKFGEEIARFLLQRDLDAEMIPINNFEPHKLDGADYLLISGWQNDSEGASFVNKLPPLDGIRTGLFTTYKFFAGSVIRRMKKYLKEKTENLEFAFKSRDGSLSISDKLTLNDFIK